MDVKDFYARYHENYKVVCKDIADKPRWYRGVNLRLCERKSIFERFNYYEQFGKEWPYEPVTPKKHPLKSLWRAKIVSIHGSGGFHDIKRLIWKRNAIKDCGIGDILFSSSKSPRLWVACKFKGVNYLQMEAKTLNDQIDNFHEIFYKFENLEHIILDEDISPDKNALCQVAKKLGVITTVICHGQLGVITGFLPLTADFMQVKWKEQKEKLIAWGLEPHRILVTKDSRRPS